VSRRRFETRNRVIAALATATVIVESGTRGGAMTAARHAWDLGRPLMAVPGPVTSELSAGCNQLIQSRRAVLVTSAADITRAADGALPTAG
jgi:DNA processing protein